MVALGGNALQYVGMEATAEAQLQVIRKTAVVLADIIEDGHNIVITHGNGPQVGRILIQNEIAAKSTPAMPFDVCGAMSQGMIGYFLQKAIGDELRNRNIERPVATILTQVVVDKDDTAFKHPTKPIGPFYTSVEAEELKKEKNYHIVEDSGRGYRRVVASPKPKRIVELETIKTLIENDHIVITVGGGGVPVIEEDNTLRGIPAVIDKDLASERLAEDINADILLILTAVDKVCINYGKIDQKELSKVKAKDMKYYLEEGHFAPGSMYPKVLAGIQFSESKPGRKTIVTSLNKAREAINGINGTIIE